MTGPNGSSFFDRLDALESAVGDGVLRGEVEFNQVYAHYQHAGVSRFTGRPLVYHRGGKDHFLHDQMIDHSDQHMRTLADRAITENGSDLHGAMIDVVREIREGAELDSPREFENLSRSGAERVYDNGELIHDRAPDVPRLTEGQLSHQRRHRDNPPDYGEHTRPRL